VPFLGNSRRCSRTVRTALSTTDLRLPSCVDAMHGMAVRKSQNLELMELARQPRPVMDAGVPGDLPPRLGLPSTTNGTTQGRHWSTEWTRWSCLYPTSGGTGRSRSTLRPPRRRMLLRCWRPRSDGSLDQGNRRAAPAVISRLRTHRASPPLSSRTARSLWSGVMGATVQPGTGIRPTDPGAVGSASSLLPPAGTSWRARRGSCPWTRARSRPSRAAPAPRACCVRRRRGCS
jgi:hypothetical protein